VKISSATTSQTSHHNLISLSSLIITLGIIYGDIGTSPLYVMKAIIGNNKIDPAIIIGAVSCVFYTLTIQTTIKYVLITIRADNHGEGGIFSLYSLLKRLRKGWIIIPAIIGGCALLADGIITPSISISSAVEGLKIYYPQLDVMIIVIVILFILFSVQRFGTQIIGKSFGPIMLLWFLMLGSLGLIGLFSNISILKAFNPYYAFKLLQIHNEGFYVLGFVFLCTTGAEALYSDLGHCGVRNVRISWIFVKSMLVINYFGQGAMMLNFEGKTLAHISGDSLNPANPFYMLMPEWFLPIGIVIATFAAIIASQALITGSFSLISEAIRLDIWPKITIHFPTSFKGQIYIPSINWLLFTGCVFVMIHFQTSSNMEAAYGLAIVLCMLMTTILMTIYMRMNRYSNYWILLFLAVYMTIEISFFVANLSKFSHGGYVSLFIAGIIAFVMFVWYFGKKIIGSYNDFVPLKDYEDVIRDLSEDETVPKYFSNLIYLTNSPNSRLIESKIIYSILKSRPKRADVYWLVHVHVSDSPFQNDYKVKFFQDKHIIRVDFYLGFKLTQRLNVLLRQVIEDLVVSKEIDFISNYPSLHKYHIPSDFKYVIVKKQISYDSKLPWYDSIIIGVYGLLRKLSLSGGDSFGLDKGSVLVEDYPLVLHPVSMPMNRIY
jgi:KUP system potassium uptake protein